MKKTRKRWKLSCVRGTLVVLLAYCLAGRGYVTLERGTENYFHIQLNGQPVGTLGEALAAEKLLLEARREIAGAEDELVFMEAELDCTGEEVLWGAVDSEETVRQNMISVLRDSIQQTLHRSYTVKVDEYMVNLSSTREVQALLQNAVGQYDPENQYEVELVQDHEREFNVLTAQVVNRQEKVEEEAGNETRLFPEGGIQAVFSRELQTQTAGGEMDFEDYPLGVLDVDFPEKVEIVEAYLPEIQLKNLEEATAEATAEQETQGLYKVVAGDTLSEIAIKVNIPMDRIVELNPSLEDENSILHVGDELIITVPEPELSIAWQEETYNEESYDAPVVYIDNDSWYTSESVVRQQPSAGFRRSITVSSYVNHKEISREILKEEVVMEAVARVVERGTKVPPTYIKPISGGRKTSGFGPRKRPTKGASTNHKGVDWATPVGTNVVASCGGTVAKAGWGSGYGYVVYINHEDGRQTRYGHLSKVLVKVGQQVKQGERIALSGNTGVSTGPHVHFEILIDGKQVDPLKYLN